MREKIKEKLLAWKEATSVTVNPLLQRIDPYWQLAVRYKQIVIPALIVLVLPLIIFAAMQKQETRQHAAALVTAPLQVCAKAMQGFCAKKGIRCPNGFTSSYGNYADCGDNSLCCMRVTPTPRPKPTTKPTPTPKVKICNSFSRQGVCYQGRICTQINNTCSGVRYINCYGSCHNGRVQY